jgi:4-hydroxy-tetrahydrodipicolinate reductase
VGKTALGTGVNPGFLMDALPLSLTAICQRVDRIEVTRVINASTRRCPFQAKIGSGMTVADFEQKMDAGQMGHVGLPESIGMVFSTFGKELVRYESKVKPVVADRPVKTSCFDVQPGLVIGLKQEAWGYTEDTEFMTLTFVAALDAEGEGDVIKITGKPNLEVKLQGTNGDIATVAIAVNAVRRVKEAAPGLVTMRDLPIITAGA